MPVYLIKKRNQDVFFWDDGRLVIHDDLLRARLEAATLNGVGYLPERSDEVQPWDVEEYELQEAIQLYARLSKSVRRVYPIWSQRDPRWKDTKLGFGNTTIGQYGCLVTSVAMMVSHAYIKDYTPADVNERLKEVDGFVGSNKNLMVFSKVVEAYPEFLKMAGLHRYPYPQSADVSLIGEADYAIVQVDMQVADPDLDEHWVIVVDREDDGDLVIHDPWTGKRTSMPPAYAKVGWTAAECIFAIALWDRRRP